MSNWKDYKRKLRWKGTMRRTAALEDELGTFEEWPVAQSPEDPYLQGRYGPWRSEWNGGRLMDIYHDESDTPLDAIEAGHYNWEAGGPFSGAAWHEAPTQEGVNRRLQEWADEYGDDYIRNLLPYNLSSVTKRGSTTYTCPACLHRGDAQDEPDGALPARCPSCGISGYTMWDDDPDLINYLTDPELKASVAEALQHQRGGGMMQTEREIQDQGLPDTFPEHWTVPDKWDEYDWRELDE